MRRCRDNLWTVPAVLLVLAVSRATADSPFAVAVVEFAPAPGQFVNQPGFMDPVRALGAPVGAGTSEQGNQSVVSLGGFGGSITLAFDHPVSDAAANPRGLDAIVFGNAFWFGGDPNRHWAECAYLEISRDANSNGLADDPWYLIPGSHLTDPVGQYEVQTWDDDLGDTTYPPLNPAWLPPGASGTWTTAGYRLPPAVFDTQVLDNPNGPEAVEEGGWGYAEFGPTLILGDLDADNVVDDAGMTAADFYTVPDDPFEVGLTPGSGGGDAFDIAWAIDPGTGLAAGLDEFDFIRVTNGVNHLTQLFGEISPEIDAVADVAPGPMGDGNWDGAVDLADLPVFLDCLVGPDVALGSVGCRVMDFDGDDDVDVQDYGRWQIAFTGG